MSEGETGEEGIESKTRSGHMQKQTFKVKQGASETDKPRNKRKENKKKSKTSSTSVPLCFIFKTSIVCVCAFSFLFVFLPLRLKKINFCYSLLPFLFFFTLYFIKLLFLGTANDESNKNKKQRAANTLQKWQSPVCAVKHKKRW